MFKKKKPTHEDVSLNARALPYTQTRTLTYWHGTINISLRVAF